MIMEYFFANITIMNFNRIICTMWTDLSELFMHQKAKIELQKFTSVKKLLSPFLVFFEWIFYILFYMVLCWIFFVEYIQIKAH
jgi:hypothetical protein